MEDRHYVELGSGSSVLVAICDGHGGAEVAQAVVERLPGALAVKLQAAADAQHACHAAEEAFAEVDAAVLDSCGEGGSTAAVFAQLKGGRFMTAYVGDVRCVLCRNGEALPLSADHRPAQQLETRRVVAAGGEVGPDGCITIPTAPRQRTAAFSRGFGSPAFKSQLGVLQADQPVVATPDVCVFDRCQGDEFVLLASDGVWDVMSLSQVVSFVRARFARGATPEAVCEELCDACCADSVPACGCDNMTVAIVVFDERSLVSADSCFLGTTSAMLKQEWDELRSAGQPAAQCKSRLIIHAEDRCKDTVGAKTRLPPLEGLSCGMTTLALLSCGTGEERLSPAKRSGDTPNAAWGTQGPEKSPQPPTHGTRDGAAGGIATRSGNHNPLASIAFVASDGATDASSALGSHPARMPLRVQKAELVPPGLMLPQEAGNDTETLFQTPYPMSTPYSEIGMVAQSESESVPADRVRGSILLAAVLSAGLLSAGAILFLSVGAAPAGTAAAALSVACGGVVAAEAFCGSVPQTCALLAVAAIAITADALALSSIDGWALVVPWVAAVHFTASFRISAVVLSATVVWYLVRLSEALSEFGLFAYTEPAAGTWESAVGQTLVRIATVCSCVAVLQQARSDRASISSGLQQLGYCAARQDAAGVQQATGAVPCDVRADMKELVTLIAAQSRPDNPAGEKGRLPQDNPKLLLRLSTRSDGPSQSPRSEAHSRHSSTSATSEAEELATLTDAGRERAAESGARPGSGDEPVEPPLTVRDAVVLRARLWLDRIAADDIAPAAMLWNRAVQEAAQQSEGTILSITGGDTCVSWCMADQSAGGLALVCAQACNCALLIEQQLAGLTRPVRQPWHSTAIAMGAVLSGELYGGIQVVAGQPYAFADALCRLARQVGARSVLSEQVYAQVRSHHVARPIDAVRDLTCDAALSTIDRRPSTVDVGIRASFASAICKGEPTVMIYELQGHREQVSKKHHSALVLFVEAFSAMCAWRCREARQKWITYLKECPGDQQGQRMLQITMWALANPGQMRGEGYSRAWVGWEDIETKADRLEFVRRDAEAAEQLTAGRRSAVWPSDSDSHSTSGSTMSTLSPQQRRKTGVQHDLLLRRAIRDAEAEANADQLAAWGIMPPQTPLVPANKALPTRITDFQGRHWTRAQKALGRGAFGEVWLGMSSEGALVAIKVMKLPSLSHPQQDPASPGSPRQRRLPRQRDTSPNSTFAPATPGVGGALSHIDELLTEVALMQSLRHENVVAYLASALVDSHVAIIMEYLSGGSLYAVLREFGGQVIPVTSVQRYVRDIVRGLAFLHSHGIVHRDMKPHNVLLGIDGQCKLADFGASAKLSQLATTSQGIIGTPMYMAPEQCRGQATQASDIWSLGVVLCQVCSGRVPYEFSDEVPFNPQAFMFRLGRNPDYGPELPGELPPECRGFARACLQRDPTCRPTAAALLSDPFLLR
eukprot:TRINITY_DN691_c0_g4_i1.p1 TRINITY_DN691_c0_g4~~TRINITY_DN691_c0_g4_i1.p1  ORF type:complete len:1619 (+),score=343.99 TRINITY_DN691_c0_g4_i1:486-4859(+)